MSELTLTKNRFASGVWEGVLHTQTTHQPNIVFSHLNTPLDGLTVEPTSDAGEFLVRAKVPPEKLGDGIQTFLISEGDSEEVLASFTLIAGEALTDDIRAEMDLLREELDMLKRAFRRHCVETMGSESAS